MQTDVVKYRLGLDLGTNSLGWAAVKLGDDEEPYGLLDLGVRIFPDGRNERSEASNAVERRTARGQRRLRDRYLHRRGKLMQAMVACGLMPEDETQRKGLENGDPYRLRARALDEKLAPFELGRALFHLAQRRGFKSNRKVAGGDEAEGGKIATDIDTLQQRITASGARTLGEFLHRRRKRGENVLARPGQGLYPNRAMYETEFDAIREAQEPYQCLNAEQWSGLREIIFYQRDLMPVEPGWCQFEYENEERRAPKALPVFQEFRMLQEVNNLRVRVGTGPERSLDENERARALKRLRDGRDINLAQKPTRDLGLPSGAVFNLAAGGRKAVKGDETTARLAKPGLFGKQWLARALEDRNEIVRFLLKTEELEAVRQKAVAEWGLNQEQAKAVANGSLTPGYGNLSEKAIGKLLPHLERGRVFSDAVQDAGYRHHSDFRTAAAHAELPYYGEALPRDAVGADPKKDPQRDGEPARYGRISNPTVHIGLNQLRRVVNRLIEVYGKPEEIVVELARELKSNREQKNEYEKQRKAGADRNERFAEMLKSKEIPVTADALRKLRLWEEQGKSEVRRVCPYTGERLSFPMVMSEQTEVDHILPFSRTLDNSMSNQVVCLASANRDKGDRTPYEAYGDKCLQYLADFPENKLWRFQEDAMARFEGERGFLDRQLNETQYLSRTARTYLAQLYDEQQRVRVVPGRMTALLRRGWGLEGMLSESAAGEVPRKSRDDHRHHAVDAFVVANTTQGLLQRFAQAAGSDYHNAEERLAALFPQPWEGFDLSQVQAVLDKVVVSYKPDHGTPGGKGQTTGQLHEATAYGLIEPTTDGQYRVALRKELADFKAKDLDDISDAPLQDTLRRLWEEVGGKAAEFAKRAAQGVLVNGRRQPVRRVRIRSERRVIPIEDRAGKPYKGYLPGGNEFAEVWRMPDGSWRTVVVPTFYANQPGFRSDDFRPHPEAKRLMRLQINDLGALGEGASRRIVRVRQMDNSKNGPRVVLDDHNEADVDARIRRDARIRKDTGTNSGMKLEVYSAQKLRRLGFRKVRVDELGRVWDRGPFKQ